MRVARLIYDGKLTGSIDPDMARMTAQHLRDAVIKGYGKDFPDIEYNSPDYRMLSSLEKNVYQFSAAKNYQELKAMTMALKDGDRILPWKEFSKLAEKIDMGYSEQWLRTEYNLAIAGSQMAGRWTEFEENADIAPMLQYVTVGDALVREEHAMLDGVIKKHDDEFWSIYYPPNGYNCRCDVIAVAGANEEAGTPDGAFSKPDIPEMFQTNLAKDGLVFPKDHPYYTDVPFKSLDKWVQDLIPDRDKIEGNRRVFNSLGPEFKEKKFDETTGGFYAYHKGHTFDPIRGIYEKYTSEILMKNGHAVELLSEKSTAANYFKKLPDGKLNGTKFEIKSIEGKSLQTVANGMKEAEEKKADIVVFYFSRPELYTSKRLSSGIDSYMSRPSAKKFQVLYIVDDVLKPFTP